MSPQNIGVMNNLPIYLKKKKSGWGRELKPIFIIKRVLTPEAFLQTDVGKWKTSRIQEVAAVLKLGPIKMLI